LRGSRIWAEEERTLKVGGRSETEKATHRQQRERTSRKNGVSLRQAAKKKGTIGTGESDEIESLLVLMNKGNKKKAKNRRWRDPKNRTRTNAAETNQRNEGAVLTVSSRNLYIGAGEKGGILASRRKKWGSKIPKSNAKEKLTTTTRDGFSD